MSAGETWVSVGVVAVMEYQDDFLGTGCIAANPREIEDETEGLPGKALEVDPEVDHEAGAHLQVVDHDVVD